MLKHLAYLALIPSLAFASVKGTGEYRYGPDMAQNIACALAEQRAKENAIVNYIGEMVESVQNELCKNEDCDIFRNSKNEVHGKIDQVTSKNTLFYPENGYTVCEVSIVAMVSPVKNEISFVVEGNSFFKNGDRFFLNAVSNRVGNVAIFNVKGSEYRLIHLERVLKTGKEFKLPNESYKFVTSLPNGMASSKESITLVFTTQNLTFEKTYSSIEFNEMIKSIPFNEKKVVHHIINIVR